MIESPRFLYQHNKITALSKVNQILMVNGQPPLDIDISRSHWREPYRKADAERGYVGIIAGRWAIVAGWMALMAAFKLN